MIFPLTCRSTCVLVKSIFTPSRYTPGVCGPLLTGQGHQRVIYLCCCVTRQLLLSLRLGLWPSESGTSEILAKRRQKILATFSNERAQKWGAKPHYVLQCGVPSNISVARGGGGGGNCPPPPPPPPIMPFRTFVGTFGNLSVHVSQQACHLYRQNIWCTDKILKEIAV